MAVYTILVKKDFDKINEYYNLSIYEFAPILGGAGNSSFICKGKSDKYVVTVCDGKSFSYVENLCKILQHLDDESFPTTQIIYPIDGKSQIMFLQDKPVIVKRYIPGEVIQTLTNDMLFQAGSMMARLHKISVPDFLENVHPYGMQIFSSIFKNNIDEKYENWMEDRLEFLNKEIPKNLPKSIIHGDLFFDNILFKNNELKAIIDFEDACHYYRVFDIGMGIVGLTIENEEINLARAKIFLQGYQAEATLEENEKLNLKIFIEYAAIATSFWRYRNYNIQNPIYELRDKHLEMVNIANKINLIPDNLFFS